MKKKILFVLFAVVLTSAAFGQNVRYSVPFPSVSTISPPFLVANVPPNSPNLHVCGSPAIGLPCTNFAATYTSSGALCPNGQQDTPDPQPSACQATGDGQGNIGFWAAAGQYDYTVCVGTNCYGPYTVTLGGSGGGGGGSVISVSGNPPLSSSGGANPTLSITQSSPTSDGYLSSTDFNTFANAGTIPPGITYSRTSAYWSQVGVGLLSAGVPGTVTLTPCPAGVDYTSSAGYMVYITDGSNSEAVSVPSGSTGTGNCAITFTPFFSHTTYTIGSASSGIQETINVACGTISTPAWNSQCNVTIPANGPYLGTGGLWSLNNYQIYGTVFLHANQSTLSGFGVSLFCHERAHCLQVGDQVKGTDYQNNTIQGIAFRSPDSNAANPAYNGCAITQTQATGTTATITTATACGFRPGDIVTLQFTDESAYWGDAIVATASGTTFTFIKHNMSTRSAHSTPGVVALAFDAVLDNGQNTHFQDILYDNGGNVGSFNNFFDFWDDENALIEHFNNNGIPLTGNVNWTGSFIYSGGNPIGPAANPGQQWASVITLRDSSITANFSNGVTVLNSNGLYIENTTIQASGPWQVKTSNETSNYQGAYIKNLYSESGVGQNPLSPVHSPFPGLGVAGLIEGLSTGVASYNVVGTGTPLGAFATGGAGSTNCVTNPNCFSYFIVVNDTTVGGSNVNCTQCQTSPMQVLNWYSTGSDSIPVKWPRVANATDTITYDVIRMTTPIGVGATYPYVGGCPGGSGGTCGYVAFHLSQAAACGNTLICTYTDSGSATTSAYTINQGNYSGTLNFWPGSIVAVSNSVKVDTEVGDVVGVGLIGQPLQVSNQCLRFGAASPGGYTSCLTSFTTANNSVKSQTATILTDGGAAGGGQTLTKGRLNFSTSQLYTLQPHHFITLVDSNPSLTQGTSTYRPLASPYDVWIGTDVAAGGVALNAGQLAFGSPLAITNYIAGLGDGVTANWGERLTVNLKEFQVLALFDLGFNVSGATTGQTLVHNGVKFVASTPGVPVDPRTTTTEIITAAADNVHLVTGNNSGAQAWTGPALANNPVFSALNIGTGLITYTPVSGNVFPGNVANQIIPPNYFAMHYTDLTNTFLPVVPTIKAFPNCMDVNGQHENFTAATGLWTCGTSATHQPAIVLVATSDTVTSGTGSNPLGWTVLTFTALNTPAVVSEDCDLFYSQQVAPAAAVFNFQEIGVSPTSISAQGDVQTASGTYIGANVLGVNDQLSHQIVNFTPSAITTIWNAHIHLTITQPFNAGSSAVALYSQTGTAADTITVKKDSKCVVNFQ